MSNERKDPDFAVRILVRMFGSILGPGLLLVPFLFPLRSPEKPWEIALFIAAPLITVVVGCVLLYWLHHHYRCPQCGRHLPFQEPEARTRYEPRYYCRECDVVWTTGVFQGGG
jgi:hypothetical protein